MRQSILLLPAELRNQIYHYIAHNYKAIKLLAHDHIVTIPLPLSQASRQIRSEFDSFHQSIPLDHVNRFIIVSNDFCIWELILSLGKIPTTPAVGVDRSIVLQIRITGTPKSESIQLFVKALAGEIAESPHTNNIVRSLQYQVLFDEDTLNLDAQRLMFARLAKKYRYHHPEGEQRVFEKIYWAFAQLAENIDGVTVKQYALGCWNGPGGGLSFV